MNERAETKTKPSNDLARLLRFLLTAEEALAHSVGTAVEKAYLRSDLKVLRMQLMSDWGAFVTSASPKTTSANRTGKNQSKLAANERGLN